MKTKLFLLVTILIPLISVANPKDFDKVQLKAQTGNAKACFKLAEYYYQGTDGLEANMDSAAYYYGKAADAGNKNAIPLAGLTNRALYKKTKDKAKLNLSIKYFSMIVSVQDIEKNISTDDYSGTNNVSTPSPYGRSAFVSSSTSANSNNNSGNATKTNPNAKWEIMQAENYYDQHYFNNAKILYRHNREDAISIIRLESFKPMPQPFLQEPTQELKNYSFGISGSSVDALDFEDVIEFAKEQQINICIFKKQWKDAVQYHQQYSNDNQAESWTWLGNYLTATSAKAENKDSYQESKWCYENAISLGDPKAYLPLARIYYKKRDYENAIKNAKKAIEYNDARKENLIVANSYYEMNQKAEAFPYWQRLAELEYTPAYIFLGECRQNGLGCSQNDDQAIACYKIGLKETSWPWAEYNLGTLYEKKMWGDFANAVTIGSDNDATSHQIDYQKKAIRWYEKSADKQYKPAMVALANLIQSTDKAKAIALADACLNDKECKPKAWKIKVQLIGDSLYSSLVEAKNYQELKNQRRFLALNGERDFEICKILSEQNYIDEMADLAYAYLNGSHEYRDFLDQRQQYSVEKDTITGFNLLLKAYELGKESLQTDIVNRYTYGRGVKQDLDKAKQIYGEDYPDYYFWNWRSWQIQKGDIEAVINTFSTEDEKNLYMSNAEALKWLQNAATKGNNKQKAEALYRLGDVYAKGRCGVTPNGPKAISYLKQSAALNYASAYYYLGWIYRTGGCDAKMNLALASDYYKKCYDLSGDQDAYYYYLHCWNRSH